MPHRILFYVSGHGYGHARRVTQVIRALALAEAEAEVFVRTSAPARVFEPLPAGRIEASSVDAGMAERGPLAIDAAGTLRRLTDLLGRRDAIVAEELAAVRRVAPGLIVADIPFLAGDVAADAGVPCVGMSNFTWDWICNPLLEGDPAYPAVREQMTAGYAKMRSILQLPFGGVSEALGGRIPVPLVAARSTCDPYAVRGQLGIHSRDDRQIALVALRGGVPDDALRAAAEASPGWLFLITQPCRSQLPGNVQTVAVTPDLDFSDLVAISDAVVSKLGYGIISDCIAAGKALLWPRRIGFREDDVVEVEGPRYLRMREIAHDDFRCGAWNAPLAALIAPPSTPETMRTDGASVCAAAILQLLGNDPAST